MRSDLVHAAGYRIENRFLLATTTMKAVRKLHVASTRTEDTINNVFVELAHSQQVVGALPAIVPPPIIDELLIVPAA
jgi:hypothetical protein